MSSSVGGDSCVPELDKKVWEGIFHLATTEIIICEIDTMAGAKANLELFDSATEILGLRGKWDQDKEDLRQVFDMMFSE